MKRSNILRIAANDWRAAIRSRAIYALAAMLLTTLAASLLVGWQNTRTLNEERARFQQLVRTNWLEQPDRHPHRTAHYGYLAFRERPPLAFFDSGIDSFAGTSVFLEAHRQNTSSFSEARQSNGLLRFGELNLALIIQLLAPLLIFFVGFASIARERESGTLALMLAQGATPREIAAGKTLGVLAVVGSLAVPLSAVATGLWLVLGDTAPTADTWRRMALLATGHAAYLFVCAAISVIVSAFSATSRGALTTLVVIWIAFWIVAPRLAQNAGALLYPAPSTIEFDRSIEEEVAREGDGHNPDDPKFTAIKRELLERYGVDDVKRLPFNYNGYIMSISEEISSGIFRRRFEEMLAAFRRQNRIAEFAGVLNPFLAARNFSMAAAGTDFAGYESFGRQSEDFRYRMVQHLNELHTENIAIENDRGQKVGRENWSEFPAFEHRPPALRETLAAQMPAVGGLIFWFFASVVAIACLRVRAR